MANATTTKTATKPKAEVIMLPCRVLWHALFERDVYQANDKSAPGKPAYKLLMGLDAAAREIIENKMADAMAAEFGDAAADAWFNGERGYNNPLKDGSRMADEREFKAKKEGKERDYTPYRGLTIVSADTTFNRDGKQEAGGAKVYSPEVETIGIVEGNTAMVYNGCFGMAAVTVGTYDLKEKGAKLYLTAFQKTADGERIKSGDGADQTSGLFQKVTPVAGGEALRRRRVG